MPPGPGRNLPSGMFVVTSRLPEAMLNRVGLAGLSTSTSSVPVNPAAMSDDPDVGSSVAPSTVPEICIVLRLLTVNVSDCIGTTWSTDALPRLIWLRSMLPEPNRATVGSLSVKLWVPAADAVNVV